MKVLFVGPTLHGEIVDGRLAAAAQIVCRPPAAQGDLYRAVLDGAAAIGLVDGRFGDVATTWHKEILFALDAGCAVYGAGSLGALRAAECAAFGMIGLGAVYRSYAEGRRFDDSDVAQVHGPAETGFLPLSEPRVNVEATIEALAAAGVIDSEVARRLFAAARRTFFADLTLADLPRRAGFEGIVAVDLAERLQRGRVDAKRADARALVGALAAHPGTRTAAHPAWALARPHHWRRFTEEEAARRSAAAPSGA